MSETCLGNVFLDFSFVSKNVAWFETEMVTRGIGLSKIVTTIHKLHRFKSIDLGLDEKFDRYENRIRVVEFINISITFFGHQTVQ